MPWLHVKQNYFNIISAFVNNPSEMLLLQRLETCPKLFRSLLHLSNMFISVSEMVTCEIE